MNPYLALVDQLQGAVTNDGDTATATAEGALRAALPEEAKHQAWLLRSSMTREKQHPCDKPTDDPRWSTVWTARRAVLKFGVTPGNPVALVTFSKLPGAATVQGFFIQGCGGPTTGDYLDGTVDGDIPHAVRLGDISNRTTADIEARLRGWRVINPDDAAAALAAAGYAPCTEHAFLHPAVTADRWTRTDTYHWTAYAVRA